MRWHVTCTIEYVPTTSIMPERMKRISAHILLLVLVSVSLTCAAMAWTPAASAHPCCPHSQQPASDRCARIECIGTTPVVLQDSSTLALELPAVAPVYSNPVAEVTFPKSVSVPLAIPPEFELFATHHQFLI